MKMQRSTVIALIVVVAAAVSIGFGYLGASIHGSKSSSSGDSGFNLLNQIQKSGQITVAVSADAPSVFESNGKWTGPGLVPLQDLADTLKVKLVAVPTPWANMVAGLQANRFDFAADLEATTQRAASIQFTDAVWDTPGVFIVPSDTPYRTSQDLLASGKGIAVEQGGEQDIALTPIYKNITRLPDYNSATLALIDNRVNAIFSGLGPAELDAQQYPQLKILVPSPPIFNHGVAYGVRGDVDPQSLAAVNTAIENALSSGEVARAFSAQHYVDLTQLGSMQLSG